MVQRINVGELRRVLREDNKNEFKPLVFGMEDTKKENEKTYSSIKKETEKYDGGLSSKSKKLDSSFTSGENRGMHDLQYDSISKPFKDRVKSQMKGYTSKQAEDEHKGEELGNATYDVDGNIYKAAMGHADKVKDGRDKASEIGLTGREINKSDIEKQRETMKENKKIRMLSFKNTKFISEGHMMSKIPDEYKTEGRRFIMRDSADNQYLVEWSSNPVVTKKVSQALVNEQKDRIKQLWGYSSPEAKTTTSAFRVQEGKEFGNMVDRARKLMK